MLSLSLVTLQMGLLASFSEEASPHSIFLFIRSSKNNCSVYYFTVVLNSASCYVIKTEKSKISVIFFSKIWATGLT